MAYLLTEIALEMLGCRFYDVYGNPHEMGDIQYDVHEQQMEREASAKNENENLETVMNFNKTLNDENQRKDKANRSLHTSKQVYLAKQPPLVTLINRESSLVQEQVLKNKAKLCKQLHHITEGNAASLMVRKFIGIEIINLRREAQNMRTFRKYVEHNIKNIDPVSFEKYCRTFSTRLPVITKTDTKNRT